MAAYRRVYNSPHLQADCQAPGSALESYARQSIMGYLLTFFNTIEWQLADWLTWGFRVRWPRHWLAAQVKWVSGPWHRACSHTAAAAGGGGSVLLKAVEHSRRRTHVDLSVQFVHQSLKQLVLGSTQLHAHLNQHTQVQALLALLTRCTDRPGSAYTTTSTHTHTHPFNGPLSGTTQVSRYQKGETNLDFTGARDSEWQWHQLGHMQVCTSLQTDNHASTSLLSFLQAGCL